jgi:hypothetical protein
VQKVSSTNLLTPLEAEAMRLFLAGEHPVLGKLRQQIEHITGVNRKLTGGGFYTTFELAQDTPVLAGLPKFEIGDVGGPVHGITYGAQFVLYVAGGKIQMLEGCVIGWEKWPSTVTDFELSYGNGLRNWEHLNRIFSDIPPREDPNQQKSGV